MSNIVNYEDGSKELIPVQYSGNISHWNRCHNEPFKGKYYRHNGYQGVSYYTDGIERFDEKYGNITTYRYEWINPHPEKSIAEVAYVAYKAWPTDVYVSRIIGVK